LLASLSSIGQDVEILLRYWDTNISFTLHLHLPQTSPLQLLPRNPNLQSDVSW
jgi:hypothetical protein